MTDCQTRLAEAREALHKLMLGGQVASVSVSGVPGRSITYTQASIAELKKYIAVLEAECGSGRGRRGCVTFRG
jgi:hypothetical protein